MHNYVTLHANISFYFYYTAILWVKQTVNCNKLVVIEHNMD